MAAGLTLAVAAPRLRTRMPLPRHRLEQLEIPDTLPGFTIRRYEPGDETRILETFNRVFAEGNSAFVPRTPAHWRWEFAQNPAGMQVYVAIHEESGAVAGHYGGVPKRTKVRDREATVTECVDSMVDRRFRGALRRPGLFVVVANRWYRDFGDGGNAFNHGLPVVSAARIGGAFLGYQAVHHQLALERPIDGARPFGGPAPPAVSEVTGFDARFDRLWTRLAPQMAIGTVRDARWLNWRFRDHPTQRYRIGAIGDASELRAYAVTRHGSFDDRDDALVVDFLVEHGDLEAAAALMRWAADRGRESGARQLSTMVPPTSRWFADLQRVGFLVRGTKYDCTVAWERRPLDVPALRREWWYTLGDFDLA